MCLSRSVIVNYANTNTHNVIMPIRFLKNRNKNKIQWEADDDRLFVHEFRLSNDRVLFVRYMGSRKARFETFNPTGTMYVLSAQDPRGVLFLQPFHYGIERV